MNTIVKIGILGLANIAKKAIIPAIKSMPEHFELAGIATSNPEKMQIISEEFKVKAFSSYEDLINCKEIEAVYIPLPNSLHYEYVKKSLEAGKHVLVEKSLACTYEEVEELNQLAAKYQLALLENFQFRKHSQLQYIKNLIETNEIGEIRSIRSSFCFPPFLDEHNIRYKKELGGGALLDAGAYPIKLAQQLLGNEIKVKAAKLNNNGLEVDIWGAGMITQKKGPLFLQFSFGFDHYYQCNLEIIGSKGILSTQRIYTAPPNYGVEIIIEKNNEKKIVTLPFENHYIKMLNYFYLCIDTTSLKNAEYIENKLQAKLIEQFFNKSK
jgi:NDP-hexose-3-ketoreductase